MTKLTGFTLIACFALVACGQSEPRDVAEQAAASASGSASIDVQQVTSLARPQPERPACSNCTYVKPNTSSGDGELSMILNSEYVGIIDDLTFIEYTTTGTNTHTFDQWVIDDLNDPSTIETILLMYMPDITRGLLIFDVDGTYYYDPVPVI